MVSMNLDKIFEGETFKNVWPSLRALANNHVRRDFAGLKRQLGRDADESSEHFTAALKADENLRAAYAEVVRNHLVGYFGEIAVHAALGRPWRDVYKFNDLKEYNVSDGIVDNCTYDVKTRCKNRWGLSVPKSKVRWDFYILCHFIAAESEVRIIGYATRDELLALEADERGFVHISLDKLHSFEDFMRMFKI